MTRRVGNTQCTCFEKFQPTEGDVSACSEGQGEGGADRGLHLSTAAEEAKGRESTDAQLLLQPHHLGGRRAWWVEATRVRVVRRSTETARPPQQHLARRVRSRTSSTFTDAKRTLC